MYKLLGSDRREYGPVNAEQVRQWIREGRANASTLAQAEGSTEWKPLSAFPEFASATGPNVPPFVTDDRKSKLVAGLLGIFLGGIGVHRFYLGYTQIGVIQIIVTIVTCGFGSIWGLIEGILIIAGTSITTDSDGKPLRE